MKCLPGKFNASSQVYLREWDTPYCYQGSQPESHPAKLYKTNIIYYKQGGKT